MTLGVRGLVHDAATNSVFLIRHTYVPGWQIAGRRRGTRRDACRRRWNANSPRKATSSDRAAGAEIAAFQPPRQPARPCRLLSDRDFSQTAPKLPDREIAEAGFFPLDRLPRSNHAGDAAADRRDFWRRAGVAVLVIEA